LQGEIQAVRLNVLGRRAVGSDLMDTLQNAEYTGRKTGDQDDEMCVKVQSTKVNVDANVAASVLKSTLSVLPKA
jgi:hypothetical protein